MGKSTSRRQQLPDANWPHTPLFSILLSVSGLLRFRKQRSAKIRVAHQQHRSTSHATLHTRKRVCQFLCFETLFGRPIQGAPDGPSRPRLVRRLVPRVCVSVLGSSYFLVETVPCRVRGKLEVLIFTRSFVTFVLLILKGQD
jgi:hypothetical protein